VFRWVYDFTKTALKELGAELSSNVSLSQATTVLPSSQRHVVFGYLAIRFRSYLQSLCSHALLAMQGANEPALQERLLFCAHREGAIEVRVTFPQR